MTGSSKKLNRILLIVGVLTVAIMLAVVLTLMMTFTPPAYVVLPEDETMRFAFSPDGKTLAVGGLPDVVMWDVPTKKVIQHIGGHDKPITAVAYSSDGKLLATGSENGTIKIYQMPRGIELRHFKAHNGVIHSIDFSPDGTILATGAREKPVLKLWDAKTGVPLDESRPWFEVEGKEIYVEEYFKGEIRSVEISPDGKKLVFCRGNGPPMLCDLSTGEVVFFEAQNRTDALAVAFSTDGKLVAGADFFKRVTLVWSVETREILYSFSGDCSRIAFSPDGKYLATGDVQILLWDLKTQTKVAEYGHEQRALLGAGYRGGSDSGFEIQPGQHDNCHQRTLGTNHAPGRE